MLRKWCCFSAGFLFPKQRLRLRGPYLASKQLPLYSRISHRHRLAMVPSPDANSLTSRIARRQVPKPRYLAQLPIACIPGLLVARVPKLGYLSLGT